MAGCGRDSDSSALSSFFSDWKMIESQSYQKGRKYTTASHAPTVCWEQPHELQALPKLWDAIDPSILCLQDNKKWKRFAQDTRPIGRAGL